MKKPIVLLLVFLAMPVFSMAHETIMMHVHPHLEQTDWPSLLNLVMVLAGAILVCAWAFKARKQG